MGGLYPSSSGETDHEALVGQAYSALFCYNKGMQNKIKKIFGFIFVLVLVLFGLIVNDNWSGFNLAELQEKEDTTNQESLKVHFLNVGQGDSIYIRTPDEVDVLIDGGPDKTVLNELGEVMPFWDRDIDVMVLTHPHSDHVTGLVEVLRRFEVKKVYYTGVVHTAPDYIAWLEEIKKQKIPLLVVKEKFDLQLGEKAQLEFLWPVEDFTNKKVSNLNNTSIVNRLVFGDNQILLTGDIEEEVEEKLLELSSDMTANILKLAHHGSKTATTEDFLTAVSPKQAIIQCGLGNDFGHPHGRVLERLRRLNVNIKRTDLDGRVSLKFVN